MGARFSRSLVVPTASFDPVHIPASAQMSLAVPCHPFGWSPESAIAQVQNAVGRLALPTGEDGPLEDVVVIDVVFVVSVVEVLVVVVVVTFVVVFVVVVTHFVE